MNSSARSLFFIGPLVAVLLTLAACKTSYLEPPEMQGPPAMVNDNGQPRLWVLSKQEEVRQVAVGGGRRTSLATRSDTFFHFAVEAFDPRATKPLWKKRLLTYGDPEAHGAKPSRVIGSSVGARLLGQDGNIVWLLIGDEPFAVKVADGSVVADGAKLELLNPDLKGLLPSEAKHYGFDNGLVLMSADARMFVVRGPGQKAVAYTPPPPAAPEGKLLANGTYELVPLRPFGEIPARQVTLDGEWLGLYSEKEAADARTDEWGGHLKWPYTVLDEGTLARRTFWRADIVETKRFDDRIRHIGGMTAIPGAPVFLKGRFLKNLPTDEPLVLEDPAGVLVWHSTRIDDAGRLALSRLDTGLKTVWKAELPLSETDMINQVMYWQLPGHITAMGALRSENATVVSRMPHLVSVDLKTGAIKAWNMTTATAVP